MNFLHNVRASPPQSDPAQPEVSEFGEPRTRMASTASAARPVKEVKEELLMSCVVSMRKEKERLVGF